MAIVATGVAHPLEKSSIVVIHALARDGVSAHGAIIIHNSYTATVTARIV